MLCTTICQPFTSSKLINHSVLSFDCFHITVAPVPGISLSYVIVLLSCCAARRRWSPRCSSRRFSRRWWSLVLGERQDASQATSNTGQQTIAAPLYKAIYRETCPRYCALVCPRHQPDPPRPWRGDEEGWRTKPESTKFQSFSQTQKLNSDSD